MKPGQYFLYYDPLDQLSETMRRRWADPADVEILVNAALANAKAKIR